MDSIPLKHATAQFSAPSARKAVIDLANLGYDIDALLRRNMTEAQFIELRDKAFRYRGIPIPEN